MHTEAIKKLKFKAHLVPKILDGSKTITWRLFDDKNLQVGDQLILIDASTQEEFAKAQIVSTHEKSLGEIGDADFEEGHERYANQEDMLRHYREYYGDTVSPDSRLKIVKFQLLS